MFLTLNILSIVPNASPIENYTFHIYGTSFPSWVIPGMLTSCTIKSWIPSFLHHGICNGGWKYKDGFRSKFEQYLQKLFTKNLLTAR